MMEAKIRKSTGATPCFGTNKLLNFLHKKHKFVRIKPEIAVFTYFSLSLPKEPEFKWRK
jgi:hypothetical protein